ncbi:hypothetical protein [Streptomyces sp. NPDC052535]|uniref:hypothetical protein n=1 Tax=Streptomyces sp. NPDC052535 TaxID=3155531 RepID=UPI0034358B0C
MSHPPTTGIGRCGRVCCPRLRTGRHSAGTALAGRLAEQPLPGTVLPGAGAAFDLTVLLAARRRLGTTGHRRRGRDRRLLRGRPKTP